MNTAIRVADRKEAHQIRQGLDDPLTRAVVNVIGILADLPSDRARLRVLRYVDDQLAEEDAQYVSVFQAER